MNEERTAEAALAIDAYVEGLRDELSILSDAERKETAGEIRTMLLDAVHDDPKHAFAEMRRLGDPAALAAALLKERGIDGEGGIPPAAWWRVGLAVLIDGGVALAAVILFTPGLFTVTRDLVTGSLDANSRTFLMVAVYAALVAIAGSWGWRYLSPWRTGGTNPTTGMAFTQTVAVRLGRRIRVIDVSDLRAAGLQASARKALSLSVILPMIVVALIWWGALGQAVRIGPPSQTDAITALTGWREVPDTGAAPLRLYEAALGPRAGTEWPAISDEAGLDPEVLMADLTERMNRDTGGGGHGDASPLSDRELSRSAREVTMQEYYIVGPNRIQREVVLTYHLRIEWPDGVTPQGTWVLVNYQPVPGSERPL